MEYISAVTRREAGIHPERVHTVTCGWTSQNPVFMLWVNITQGKRWNHWNHFKTLKSIWSPGPISKGCSASLWLEQELGLCCRQQVTGSQEWWMLDGRAALCHEFCLYVLWMKILGIVRDWDLQHVLGWFSAKCEAAGMQISPSKSGLS